MKILIVDDSKAMRMIVKRTLKQAGFSTKSTLEAENGKEALEQIREQQPDVVISDWNMPQMSGLELLQALRSEDDQRSFGFVTTEATPEMREIAKEAGASFLIGKPFTPETFQIALEPVLGK